MMENRKKRKTIEFPPDILVYNILTRLPVKSLFRCKCVSKQWHCFITTSTVFEKYHHLHHHKLLFLSCKYFRTIDCEALQDDFARTRPLPFKTGCAKIEIITSHHGLVCLGMKEPKYDTIFTHLILWNPLTSEYKTLSNSGSNEECYQVKQRASVLYYNSFEDDYMLLRVTYNRNVYIYSLKSNSWRNIIYSTRGCLEDAEHWTPSNPMNGMIYFLKRQMIKNEENVKSLCSIIRFDTKTEKFTEEPTHFENIKTIKTIDCLSLTALPGHIRIYTFRESPCATAECWRMNGHRNVPENVLRFHYRPFVKWWQLMHVMQDENIWIMISDNAGYIMKVNMDMNTHEISSWYEPHSMYITPRHKYIETYVSPNRYVK